MPLNVPMLDPHAVDPARLPSQDRNLRDIAIGLAGLGVALLAKSLLRSLTGQDLAYLTLFAALPVAVLLGGFNAGAILVLGGALLDVVIFQAGPGEITFADPAAVARFWVFLPVGLMLAWLIDGSRRARERADLSSQRYARLVELFPDFVVMIDPQTWQIRYVNQAVIALGWTAAGLAGSDVERLIPGLREATQPDPVSHAAPDPRPTFLTVVSPTGDDVPVEVLVQHVQGPLGEPRLLASARDIREQIEANARLVGLARTERSRVDALQQVIGTMDEGVALTGPSGAIVLANDAMSDIVGHPVASIEDLPGSGRLEAGSGDIKLGDPERWLQVRTFGIGEGEGDDRSHLVMARDVTKERELAAARDAFIGVLSHELRTPVTTILGLGHVLARPHASLGAPQRLELAGDIAAEAERLNALVEDLLVLSRAQGGQLDFEIEPVLVQHALAEAIKVGSEHYPHVHFSSDLEGPLPPVTGDRTYLGQVLRNLIGNAGKYSPSTPSEVQVSARSELGAVVIRVLDQGPGFDPEDADRLFDIYFRSRRTARARAGSGIGLYVTRTLVEAMGGRVWADLRPQGGSEFGFELPVFAAIEPPAEAVGTLR